MLHGPLCERPTPHPSCRYDPAPSLFYESLCFDSRRDAAAPSHTFGTCLMVRPSRGPFLPPTISAAPATRFLARAVVCVCVRRRMAARAAAPFSLSLVLSLSLSLSLFFPLAQSVSPFSSRCKSLLMLPHTLQRYRPLSTNPFSPPPPSPPPPSLAIAPRSPSSGAVAPFFTFP